MDGHGLGRGLGPFLLSFKAMQKETETVTGHGLGRGLGPFFAFLQGKAKRDRNRDWSWSRSKSLFILWVGWGGTK